MALTPRQLDIHDFLTRYHRENEMAPTMAEIREHFGLSSPATVHQHLSALEHEGLIRRQKHIQRGIELLHKAVPEGDTEIPLLGLVAAGVPIEAVLTRETICVSRDLYKPERFALRVRGDSMKDEHIADGDFIIVEPPKNGKPRNGQTVVALIDNSEATVKKFYDETNQIRLEPANPDFKPIFVKPPHRLKVQGIVVGLMRKFILK